VTPTLLLIDALDLLEQHQLYLGQLLVGAFFQLGHLVARLNIGFECVQLADGGLALVFDL
jgi:hypothetical protein